MSTLCVWLGGIGKYYLHSSKLGFNTDLGPAALGPYWTPISQNSDSISQYLLARRTVFLQSCFLMKWLIKVMQNCMHNFEKYFFTKSTKLEKENLNVFGHISGLTLSTKTHCISFENWKPNNYSTFYAIFCRK